MSDLVFLVMLMLATFLVVMPGAALLSRLVLRGKRDCVHCWADYGSDDVFAWLVAPTLLPLLSLLSLLLGDFGTVWGKEGGRVCALGSAQLYLCPVTWLGILLLALGLTTVAVIRLRRERTALGMMGVGGRGDGPLGEKLRRIQDCHESLKQMQIEILENSPQPLCSVGMLRPRILIDACFVEQLDDDALLAALLHEWAHTKNRDILRTFLLRLSFAINPGGILLVRQGLHWRCAREAACDSEAVFSGADPLALAQSLLKAVRFRCGCRLGESLEGEGHGALTKVTAPVDFVSLCGCTEETLRLRITLLLDGPQAYRGTFGNLYLVVWMVLAVVIPHLDRVELLHPFFHAIQGFLFYLP